MQSLDELSSWPAQRVNDAVVSAERREQLPPADLLDWESHRDSSLHLTSSGMMLRFTPLRKQT
jgi:hypothetical protein